MISTNVASFSLSVILIAIWTIFTGLVLRQIVRYSVEWSDTFAKFVAKHTGGEAVMLQSVFGETYRTIARKNVFGKTYANVYYANSIGGVVLEENGNVSSLSESSYIKKWAPIK